MSAPPRWRPPASCPVKWPATRCCCCSVAAVLLDATDQPIGIEIAQSLAPDAPPLWFAEIRESTGRPPAANLVAFTGHGIADGRLLDEAALRDVDVGSHDQIAAVRWYP